MIYPTFEEVKELSKSYNVIPISMEVYADMETPISLFKRFIGNGKCFLLESVEGGEKWARYSFIGRKPFLRLSSRNGVNIISQNGVSKTEEGNPLEILKNILKNYKSVYLKRLPRFTGGAVGYIGYDIIRFYENLPLNLIDDVELPDCEFMFTNEVIAYDHLKQKIHIIVNLHTDDCLDKAYTAVVERIKEIYKEIIDLRWKVNTTVSFEKRNQPIRKKSNVTKEEFCENVIKAKEYIKNGDIFQVVLSQRFEVENYMDPLDVYRALRIINPSPYMYYLEFGDFTVIGSSPELLMRVENRKVETCPIAGTRRRGNDEDEDLLLEKELLSDEKELAEHAMLVDLARNDVGKVSKFGTVKVINPMHVERYSHVMHIVTNVVGELQDEKDVFDVIPAIIPAGTVSGAPKIRAMQIIDELEKYKRGPYGGALGYIGFDGVMDMCLTIRTLIFKDNKAYLQAGAGIVADSIPEREYEETLRKAEALLKAIEEAGEIR